MDEFYRMLKQIIEEQETFNKEFLSKLEELKRSIRGNFNSFETNIATELDKLENQIQLKLRARRLRRGKANHFQRIS